MHLGKLNETSCWTRVQRVFQIGCTLIQTTNTRNVQTRPRVHDIGQLENGKTQYPTPNNAHALRSDNRERSHSARALVTTRCVACADVRTPVFFGTRGDNSHKPRSPTKKSTS